MRARLGLLALIIGCGGDGGDDLLRPPYLDARYPPAEAQLLAEPEPGVRQYTVGSTVPGVAGRTVVVILPPGYDEPGNSRRYPVLFMGDGQNVLGSDAFGHGGWQLPQAVQGAVGEAEPVIIIAPFHGGSLRRAEYTRRHQDLDAGATPEHYLDWLQYNVMPWADAELRTVIDASRRGIGGSSSAAILALYAGWTRPGVYRRIIAMSTYSWDTEQLVADFSTPGDRPPLKVYMDCGSPSDGCPDMAQLSEALKARGFTEGVDLSLVTGEGHAHNERFWRERFPAAYRWMYPP